MISRFETLTFDKTVKWETSGMRIKCFIAGVNSGAYGLPFVVEVSTWIKTFWGRKKYYRTIHLTRWEIKRLRDELTNVLNYVEEQENKHK